MGARYNTLQYHEGSRKEFGLLTIIHLSDLLTVETQVSIGDKTVLYGMRLGWKRGRPPLTGELVSLHLPQSKILVRVSRVTRTCVCCPQGIVHLYVEQLPGVSADATVCDCAKTREMKTAKGWRDIAAEVECPRKSRSVLRRVSDILKQGSVVHKVK